MLPIYSLLPRLGYIFESNQNTGSLFDDDDEEERTSQDHMIGFIIILVHHALIIHLGMAHIFLVSKLIAFCNVGSTQNKYQIEP